MAERKSSRGHLDPPTESFSSWAARKIFHPQAGGKVEFETSRKNGDTMGPIARRLILAGAALISLLLPTADTVAAQEGGASGKRPVYVVLFTHIEDNTPAGALGSAQNRAAYLSLRTRLLEMATMAQLHGVRWSLEPDWKVLLAAQQYEDTALMSTTGGMNVLRYLQEVLGVAIDPHSHEGGGYNYTDVAHLLATLGVGGSTVIGGHIWDPGLPQFQEWDRFRAPVRGERYPAATWRGDILMGSGTPNHVNDPIISGVWRPQNRNAYFVDDPSGNIACVGAFRRDLPGITELSDLYRTGRVGPECMLTASYGIRPADIMAPGGLKAIEDNVIRPLADLREDGYIVLTDFTALIATWKQEFAGRACMYVPSTPASR